MASTVKLTVKETNSDHSQNPFYTLETVEFLEDGASEATWVASAIKSDGMKLPDILSAETNQDIAPQVEQDNNDGGESRKDRASSGIDKTAQPRADGNLAQAPISPVLNQPPLDLNIGYLRYTIKPERTQEVLVDLNKRLEKMMIRNVDLHFEDMPEQDATEIKPNGDISFLISASLNDRATLNYEANHVCARASCSQLRSGLRFRLWPN